MPWVLLKPLAGLALVSGIYLRAQDPKAAKDVKAGLAQVQFSLDWDQALVPHYRFAVREDGSGTYTATVKHPGAADESVSASLAISPATVAALFQGARDLRGFRVDCASHAKVAMTGTKMLRYVGPDGGEGSCTFNYSERPVVQSLTAIFQGMEATLEAGRKLAFDHQYDRLGLGQDMSQLTTEVKDGRALEIGNIVPTLQELAADPDVLARVRERAAALLATVQQQPQ